MEEREEDGGILPTASTGGAEPTLLQLAERCEREEPSREVDCHIAMVMGYGERGVGHKGSYKCPVRVTLSEMMANPAALRQMVEDDDVPEETIPRFTTSLDAAVTLVEEGVEWNITNLYGIARAEVGLNCNDGWQSGDHKGGLLAMALCAAALRARAEMKQ